MSHSLTPSTVTVAALRPAQREAMWALLEAYYDGVSRAQFEADLEEKSHVILLSERARGALQGFSTLRTYTHEVSGRRLAVLYSGDTIIAREHWGQTALQRAWLTCAMGLKLRCPRLPTYWFLTTKGYKTYLLLSRNFPEYWPRHDLPTPPWQRAVIDALAGEKFGAAYRPELGLLRREPTGGVPCRLKTEVAPIRAADLRHPDIRFFEQQNPGYAGGDELCCIGRIDARLCLSYLLKLAGRAGRRLA